MIFLTGFVICIVSILVTLFLIGSKYENQNGVVVVVGSGILIGCLLMLGSLIAFLAGVLP